MRLQRVILTLAFVALAFLTWAILLKLENNFYKPAEQQFKLVSFASDKSYDRTEYSRKPSVFFRERNEKQPSVADSLITYAKSLIGTPYFYTGKCVQSGFDCSGFTHHVFEKFGYELTPGSDNQAIEGTKIPMSQVRKGDLLIFTGTNLKVREPGHVGIVITGKGERPIKFIHSSSDGGVKISQVDSTTYAKRLLQVRRLIN